MVLLSLIGFIKSAFAGTGTAKDINTLIIIIVLFLFLLLAITYLVSAIHRNWMNHLQNRNGEEGDALNDYEIYDDFDSL